MAFESNRPFGFRGGFQPGREYASPFGAMRPEMIGLDVIGEAAQQARQFPVIAGGGRGLVIPGLSQVEVTGGPSRIGDEPPDEAAGLLAGLQRDTQIGNAATRPDPAQLALTVAKAALSGGRGPRDLSNLTAFSGEGGGFDPSALRGLSEAQVADVLMGGTVAPPPGEGAAAGGSFSPGGAVGGGIGAGLGLLNLITSARSGDVAGGVGGGLGTVAGLTALLKAAPELASALGLSPGALSGTSAVTGGLSGLLGVGTGIQGLTEGDTTQGALQLAQGLYALLGATPSIYSAVSGVAPAAIQAGTSALGAAGPALSSLGTYSGGVLMAAQALADSLMEMEGTAKLKSGALNNPIKGQLYSNATEGVAHANDILRQITEAGGAAGIPTDSLMTALAPLANSLLPYYTTAQGGVKALRPSEAAGSPGTQSKDEYTSNFTQAQQGLTGLVQELLRRGVTYEQLGQVPGVSLGWTSPSLDAGGRPEEYYARRAAEYAPQAAAFGKTVLTGPGTPVSQRTQNVDPTLPHYQAPVSWDEAPRYATEYTVPAPPDLFIADQGFSPHVGSASFTPWAYLGGGTNGSPLDPTWMTPENWLKTAIGEVGVDPNAVSPAVAKMYGGPLWTALARMGAPGFTDLIQQNFDPWVGLRAQDPASLLKDLSRYALSAERMRQDEVNSQWTSAGGL